MGIIKKYDESRNIYTNINTVNFSVDYLQYLLNTKNLKLSDTYSLFLQLKVNDTMPVFGANSYPYKISYNYKERKLATVNFKNLYECLEQFSKSLESASGSNSQGVDLQIGDYGSNIKTLRHYYKSQLDKLTTLINIKQNVSDNVLGIKHPCKTSYGITTSNSDNFKDDPNDYYRYNYPFWRPLCDCVKKYINPEHTSEYKNSIFVDNEGNIREDVLIDVIDYNDIDNVQTKCYIIGYPTPGFNLNMKIFKEPEYDAIISDHINNYESYIKQLLIIYHEKNPDSVDITDLIFDYLEYETKYCDDKKLLSAEDVSNFKKILRLKLKKLFGDKFKLPNVGLNYGWEIVVKNADGTLEPLIYTFREINKSHLPVFTKILDIIRSKFLEKYKIPKTDQIFSYVKLDRYFNINTEYVHPLHFLSRKNTFYNKIITLEELIKSCILECDGTFNGMEKYKGLPFWAVCPMNYSLMNTELDSYNKVPITRHNSRHNSRYNSRHYSRHNSRHNRNKKTQKNNNKGTISQTVMLLSNNNKITDKSTIMPVIKTIFNETSKIILAYNNYSDHITLLIRVNNVDGTIKYYNVVLKIQMNNSEDILSKINELEYYDTDLLKVHYYGYSGNLFRILLVEEYNLKEKFKLKSLYLSLYRQYNGLDTIFKEDTITSNGITIQNPYKYHIIKLISLIHSLCFSNKKINLETLKNPNGILYENFKDETNLSINNTANSIDFRGERDNNVYFIYKHNKYLGILDRFSGDVAKSKHLTDTYLKHQNKKIFKFTLWIVPIEVVIDIFNKIESLTGQIGNIQNFVKSEVAKKCTLYQTCSINKPDEIQAIDEILKGVKIFISAAYGINEYDFNVMNINELSDIPTSSFHIHIEPKSQYFKPLEQIHFEKEFLSSKTDIYRYSANIQGHFSFEHILDKLKTHSDYYFNKSLSRPFSGLIKASGLLTL